MKKIFCLVMTCLFSCLMLMTAAASEEQPVNLVSYDETNSFQVTIKTTEKKVFTPEDFPQIPCTDVYVASISKSEDEYYYTLILVCEGVDDLEVEKEKMMETAVENTVVPNQYVTKEKLSTMTLSKDSLYLKVGESADVKITDLSFIDRIDYPTGILISLDLEVFDLENLKRDIFVKYGVNEIYTEAEAKDLVINDLPISYESREEKGAEYRIGIIDVKNSSFILEEYVTIIDALSKVAGVETADIFYNDIIPPGGLGCYEDWEITNNTVVSIKESGGELYDETLYPGSLIGKTATVSALKPGITTLSVVRRNCFAFATKTCEISVYIPGDVDLNNEVNADDALEILKHVVKLKELPKVSLIAGDLNEDQETTAEDALDILKVVVGLK